VSKGQTNCALDWEDIRVFAALARHRTLARTGDALELRRTEITRRIANLERALGRKLFSRSSGRFRLNPAGVAAFAEAAQMEMAACALVEARDCACAAGAVPRGDGSSVQRNIR
jgi:DNA-binding transcriptional LysR family regulator